MIVRLTDLPELPPWRFQYSNAVGFLHIPVPAYRDTASGCVRVDKGFDLIGWCRRMPSELMRSREGQIGIMLYSEEDGEVWQHYPVYDEDDYKALKFVCAD